MIGAAADQSHPWECLISQRLGPAAAGRIDWVRWQETAVAPRQPAGPGVQVLAPKEWTAQLHRAYSEGPDDGPALLRHVIGRAVTTSSGTLVDIGGDASASHLVGVQELAAGPAVVVLQAEPTDVAVDGGLTDDAPEKLTLAADLIEAGVQAVMVLPALQLGLARIVWRHLDAVQQEPPTRERLTTLWVAARAELRPHVAATVLDDLVLITNGGWDV